MSKFIVGSFLVMGLAFYELSGGADFEPEVRPTETAVATTASQPQEVSFTEPEVTRTASIELPTLTLDNSETIEVEVVQAALTTTPEIVEPVIAQTLADIRAVAGKRVNMRSGPGTNYNVLDTLPRGTEAEVIAVNSDGWAEIKILSTGQIGWMAERLLTDS